MATDPAPFRRLTRCTIGDWATLQSMRCGLAALRALTRSVRPATAADAGRLHRQCDRVAGTNTAQSLPLASTFKLHVAACLGAGCDLVLVLVLVVKLSRR
jgi:beta-lactamase class A